MFNNIGKKIKNLAKIICYIGIIASIIAAIVLLFLGDIENMILISLPVLVAGIILSWIGSIFTYGFGELIENSAIIAQASERKSKTGKNNNNKKITVVNTRNLDNEDDISLSDKMQCSKCDAPIDEYPCVYCGYAPK